MSDDDIVVIGAGAAGLAAARRITALGSRVRVLESRQRLGGRAFTSHDSAGNPIELGCGWMHSADQNEFAGLAPELGFTIDKTRPPWRTQLNDIAFPPTDQQDFRAAAARFFERLDAVGEVEPDRAAHLVLDLVVAGTPSSTRRAHISTVWSSTASRRTTSTAITTLA
jgi:monoamine oxidase